MSAAKPTPLLGFLRALTVEQQNLFAESVGTTRVYLYQLAAQPHPNPRLRLAVNIVQASKTWGKRFMAPPLALEDMLVGVHADARVTSRVYDATRDVGRKPL